MLQLLINDDSLRKLRNVNNFRDFFQGMEINFTSREIRVSEMLMENRSVSFFCRLLLWRFTKICKYGFCTAENIHQAMICYHSFQEILKSHAECWLTYKFPVQQLRLLRPRTSALLLERKIPIALLHSKTVPLTAIEHFNAELR